MVNQQCLGNKFNVRDVMHIIQAIQPIYYAWATGSINTPHLKNNRRGLSRVAEGFSCELKQRGLRLWLVV